MRPPCASTIARAIASPLDAMEADKDPLAIGHGDARAVVGDADLDGAIVARSGGDVDGPARGGVLDGVADEVPDDLGDAVAIGGDGSLRRRQDLELAVEPAGEPG